MTRSEPFEGVLPVDKPVGPTSHDVVAMTRRALHTRRVGHAGTLDPFASGLLLLCIGQATRIVEYVTGLPKTYVAQVRLGAATDTDDPTGTIISESAAWHSLERVQLEQVLAQFRGDILQLPSTYSAKQVGGERAYRAARAGRALALDPVPVRIDTLHVLEFAPPQVSLAVRCSSGTYIRALARDIGAALGVGAHLTALRRTAIGPHAVADAIDVAELSDAARVEQVLISTVAALGDMPRIELNEEQVTSVRFGQALRGLAATGTVALIAEGELVAIAEADGDRVRPRKVFLS